MINVTKTFFPPIEDYQAQVQRIWDNQWLTNNGELYKELSHKLQEYLGVNKKLTMSVPSRFFNQGTLYLDIQISDGRKLHFRAEDVVAFTFLQEGTELGKWMGKSPGPLKPVFDWINS
jgi:hypothetical protein